MALITTETASNLGKRSGEARRQRKLLGITNPTQPVQSDAERRRERLEKQLDILLDDIAACRNKNLRCKLHLVHARVWELLYPKPGSLRPKDNKPPRRPVEPQPEPPKAASSVPEPTASGVPVQQPASPTPQSTQPSPVQSVTSQDKPV